MNNESKALSYIGPSFEDLTHEEMLNLDGQATPSVVLSVITYAISGGGIGWTITVTIDRIFGNRGR